MIEDKEEKLENELSELRAKLNELKKERVELERQIKIKEKKLCDLLDYDIALDII